MARTVADQKIESKTDRAKLKPSPVPYWRAIEPGLHIGFRKGKAIGQWVARHHIGARAGKAPYEWRTLKGCAEDTDRPADGATVLSYKQAVQWVRAAFAAPKPMGPITVRQAIERYIAYLKAEKKTGPDTEQRLAKHVLPRLGDRPIADLSNEEIEGAKRAMVRRDPTDPEVERKSRDTANRVLTSLKAALNKAFKDPTNQIASDAAWRHVVAFKGVGRAREVFLDPTQAKRLINVCSGAFRNLVTAALLTGARPPHELAGMRVRDFRADLGTLTVTGGKTGRRDIVLTQEAIHFFAGLAAGRAPDAFLLPKDDGTAWGKWDHHDPMRAAVAKAKLPKGCTIYCLRHTHASQALLNGINTQFLAENMGTSLKMLEHHYGKFSAASRRQLIEASGFKLGLKQNNVRTLRRSV
jgi:integrase